MGSKGGGGGRVDEAGGDGLMAICSKADFLCSAITSNQSESSCFLWMLM